MNFKLISLILSASLFSSFALAQTCPADSASKTGIQKYLEEHHSSGSLYNKDALDNDIMNCALSFGDSISKILGKGDSTKYHVVPFTRDGKMQLLITDNSTGIGSFTDWANAPWIKSETRKLDDHTYAAEDPQLISPEGANSAVWTTHNGMKTSIALDFHLYEACLNNIKLHAISAIK